MSQAFDVHIRHVPVPVHFGREHLPIHADTRTHYACF